MLQSYKNSNGSLS